MTYSLTTKTVSSRPLLCLFVFFLAHANIVNSYISKSSLILRPLPSFLLLLPSWLQATESRVWGQVSKSTVDLQDKGGLHTFNNPIMMVQTSFCFSTYVVITPVTIHSSCSTAEMAMQQELSRSYTWILLKRLLRKLCHLSNRDNYCGHELLKCHLNQSFFFFLRC